MLPSKEPTRRPIREGPKTIHLEILHLAYARGKWGSPRKILTLGKQRGFRLHKCVLSHSVMSDSLWPHGLQPTRLLCPWDSPGKNTWVAISFSRGSSWSRDWTCISCTAGRFFTAEPLGKLGEFFKKKKERKLLHLTQVCFFYFKMFSYAFFFSTSHTQNPYNKSTVSILLINKKSKVERERRRKTSF